MLSIKVISGLLPLFTVVMPAQAVITSYQAIDLTEPVAGEYLWRYQYPANGYTFSAHSGFNIAFDIADGFSTRVLEILAMPVFWTQGLIGKANYQNTTMSA